jgi:hypothetical protein
LVLLAGLKLFVRLGRKMEKRADSQAAGWEPAAGVYARALEKIYQANLAPAVLRSKRAVHPDLYDRILAAGVTPDYPRPDPPPGWGRLLGVFTMVLASVFGFYARRYVGQTLPDVIFERDSANLWKMGAGHEEIWDVIEPEQPEQTSID